MAHGGSSTSTFVGRQAERARLTDALRAHRLVSVTGPGGAGKTRLALEVAGSVAPDAHTVVELAPCTAADLTGLAERLLASPSELVVLDNAEHLLDEVAAMVAALVPTSTARLLVTSREALRIEGEAVVPLLSLEPDDAVRLLADRAALVGVTVADDVTSRTLCEHLDGLPLAIELAAAQLRDHGVLELDAALADRFRVLVRRSRTRGDDRHRSLEATIDDSYERLAAEARRTFAAASVFRTWFTRAELAALTDPHHLRDLVDASLVVADTDGPVARFRMLDSIRHHAGDRLAEDPTHRDEVHHRFASWALDVAAAHPLGTEAEAEHLTRLDVHAPNLVAALDLAPADLALRLAVALAPYAERRAGLDVVRRRLEAHIAGDQDAGAAPQGPGDPHLLTAAALAAGRLALRQSDLDGAEAAFTGAEALAPDDATRAAATAGLGRVARRRGRYELAEALLGNALKVLRKHGSPADVATCVTELGRLASLQGRRHDATAFLTEAIERWRELGDRRGIVDATTSLAKGAEAAGDLAAAEARLREAVEHSRALGDPHQIAAALANLADVRYLREGGGARYEEPERLHLEVLEIAERIGDRRRQAGALNALGTISYRRTEFGTAIERWTRTLELCRAIGDRRTTMATLASLANVTAMDGDPAQAWVLINDALRMQRELGEPRAVMLMLHPTIEIARDTERWAEATRLAVEAERLAVHAGDPLAEFTARYHGAYVAIVAGDRRRGLRQALDVAASALAHGERHLTARAVEAAALALAPDDPAAATFLLGAGEGLRGATPFTAYYRPSVRARVDAAVAHCRQQLGERFEPTWLDGHGADPIAALARAEAAVAALAEPGAAARPPSTGTWRQEPSGLWTVGLDGHEVTVADSKGMRYLRRLLSCPGTPVAAVDLAGADVLQAGLPVADAAAVRAYRAAGTVAGAEGSAEERIGRAGSAATRRDGELRLERGTNERARKAVTKCLRDAIARLEPAAPDLARHLAHGVKTGAWCCYEPERPVAWDTGAKASASSRR